jgi:hypothetical protein
MYKYDLPCAPLLILFKLYPTNTGSGLSKDFPVTKLQHHGLLPAGDESIFLFSERKSQAAMGTVLLLLPGLAAYVPVR